MNKNNLFLKQKTVPFTFKYIGTAFVEQIFLKHKSIKKIYKILSIFLLSVVVLPTLGYILLHNHKIQNYIAISLTHKLSIFFGTNVKIESVSYDLFNRLVIHNLYIEDQRHDTLLFSEKTLIDIQSVNLGDKLLRFDKIELQKAYFHLFIDSSRTVNLQFVIDKLTNDKDTLKKGWDIRFNNIGLFESRFTLEDIDKPKKDTGINFSHLRLTDLNIKVKDLKKVNTTLVMKINRLGFKEHSGFRLDNLSSKLSIKKSMMHFDNLEIKTSRTSIDAPKIYFDFSQFKDFASFAQKVKINFQLERANCSFIDIAFFAPTLWGMGEDFSLSGSAKGMLSDLRCRQIQFNTGSKTSFSGNISLTGLPSFKETYMYIEAKDLKILPSDLGSMFIPNIPGNVIQLPDLVLNAGLIGFKGSFTGFVNDFVTYGTFKTNFGIIKSDLSLKPRSKREIDFNGRVSALHFNAGKLLSKEADLGFADINLTADGTIKDNSHISAVFNGNFDNLDYKGYTYNGIEAKGALLENAFDGSVSLTDPNIKLYAFGHFNFSKKTPEFNFTAGLADANLFKLHWTPHDSIYNVSCQVSANFKGNRFDKINGDVHVLDAKMEKKDSYFSVSDLVVHSDNEGEIKKLDIASNILDAKISGTYNFETLKNSLIKFFKCYMPKSFNDIKESHQLNDNQFTFDIKFKNTKNLFDFFAPGFELAPLSQLKGEYNPFDSLIRLDFNTKYFAKNQVRFDNLSFKGIGNKDSLHVLVSSAYFTMKNQVHVSKLLSNVSFRKDSSRFNLVWSDSVQNKSFITSLAHLENSKSSSKPLLVIDLNPSKVYALDSLWLIDKAKFTIDSSSVTLPGLSLTQNNHKIVLSGTVSENNKDTMLISFENFDMLNLNYLLKTQKLVFEGMLNGKVSLSDFYNTKKINSTLTSKRLVINGEELGNTNFSLRWDNDLQKVIATADAFKNEVNTTHIKGTFTPSNEELNFSIDVNKIGAILFQPFIESVFIIQKGNFTGHLTLTGTAPKPILNGELDLNETRLLVNFLKTSYKFDTRLTIEDNKFMLNNIRVSDRDKNICVVNGSIANNYFKSFNLDINLALDKNMVLNTLSSDNQPFYGKGYASGLVKISGQPGNIVVDILQAKTEKNTVIYIPLNRQSDLAENDFVTFMKSDAVKAHDTVVVPKSFELKSNGLTVNIALEVTPDAEVQLVFDSKTGDIMRSQGSGNLKMEVNKSGNFIIRGDYTIESGDYLFTLQNVINKKFTLQPGGVIAFTGNPLDANLDVKAIYKTKASLYNLLGAQAEEYKNRLPIECQLFLSGKLQNPSIKYDIVLPNASEKTKTDVRNKISNEEELSKQFLSLLVLNNFYLSENQTQTGATSTQGTTLGRDIVSTTSMELLSSQLSNWMSQVSKDIDIGFNYHPGYQNYTSQEVEVALSTQLLNDRVTINGNLDVIGNQVTATKKTTGTTNLVGDVNVEVKLTEKLRLKAFNRSNDQFYSDQELYTQGVGVVYREEFGTLAELRRRYYQRLFAKKADNKKPSGEQNKNQTNNVDK